MTGAGRSTGDPSTAGPNGPGSGGPGGPAPGSPLPVDTLGMWEATAALPEQLSTAAAVASATADAAATSAGSTAWASLGAVTDVTVVGTGVGAFVGHAVAALAAPALGVPVTVVDSAAPRPLPAFVGERSLVVAVSWSGRGAGTRAMVEAARAAGATVATVAGAGDLAATAEASGSPLVTVPAGAPVARAALGALVVPVLVLLDRAGLFPGAAAQVEEAVGVVARRRDGLVERGGLAEEIARRIGRTFPLVHGATGLGATAARRWKSQVNENAKSPAFWSAQPAFDELAGWGQHGDVTRQLLTVVRLRHGGEGPAASRGLAVVGEVLDEVVADVLEVRTDADGDVARFFDLVMVGDFVSLHLAAREGIDPGPVPVHAQLSARLAEPPA